MDMPKTLLAICEDRRPDLGANVREAYRAVCGECWKEPEKQWDTSMPSRGFGDTIAKLTTAIGIPPCGGCKKSQAKFNNLAPYKKGK